jgi:hypothetical protein
MGTCGRLTPPVEKVRLGYLVADEPLLVKFAGEAGFAPEEIVRALARLEGPPVPGLP